MNYLEKFKNENTPVLMQFYAEWCAPCRMLMPIVNDVDKKLNGKIIIDRIDIDNDRQASSEFGIRSVPTLILVKNGEIIWRHSGLVQENQLLDLLEEKVSVKID